MDQLQVIPQLLLIGLGTWLLSTCIPSPETVEQQETPTSAHLWVGTYTDTGGSTNSKSEGIYRLSRDTSTGALRREYVRDGIINPSFISLSPDGHFLYAVSQTNANVDSLTAYVYAYAIQGDSLAFLNRQATHSFRPCHVSVHPGGNQVYVASYTSGVITAYQLDQDGQLSPATDSLLLHGSGPHPNQGSAHPHSVFVSPDGQWLYVPDLGTDKVMIFQFNQDASWKAASPAYIELPPGAGPRHFAFHPSRPFAYSINELNSTVTAFQWQEEDGSLSIIQHASTLPDGFAGENATADIHLTPDGRFLYASNRGHNSVARFAVNPNDGHLGFLGATPTGGEIPRNFNLTPDGKWLYVANQNTDNIVGFSIDPASGNLSPKVDFPLPTPVCLVFD